MSFDRIAQSPQKSSRMILPNSFTFSYRNEHFTACQHDILILLFEKLQGFMTTRAPQGCPVERKVTVDASEVMRTNNKEHVLEAARGLMDLEFGFRYIRDEFGNVNRVWGVFITTVEDIKGTSLMRLTINPDIFPVLTYYGESVGGTLLLKDPALETKGRHAKTIREMLISRRDIGYIREDLDEFKRMLGLSPEYRPSCLRKDILEPVRTYLEKESDIWFEYEILSERVPGRKSRGTSIFIWIYTRTGRATQRKGSFSDYNTVWSCARTLAGDPCSHRGIEIADAVCAAGRLHFMADKCRFYLSRAASGEMTREHADNTIRKILHDEFSLDV